VQFEQLTFRRARIGGARFVADGRAVVYSEAREGHQLELARIDLAESPPARPLGYAAGTEILASRPGEIALAVDRQFLMGERFVGALAIAPLGSGAPRRLEENIEDADWDAQGQQMAVVRSTGGMGGSSQLEYPRGIKRHSTSGSIRFARISRDGRRVAFQEDAIGAGEGGHVSLLDLETGEVKALTGAWRSLRGLAWSPDGREVWFTAGPSRTSRVLRAVTPEGRQRIVMGAPGSLTLWDVTTDGQVLLSRDDERRSLVGMAPTSIAERELSWFDDSGLADVSDDGQSILFSDRFGIYLGGSDGSQPMQLGLNNVYADDLSPDGRMVLATRLTGTEILMLASRGGSPQPLPPHNIVSYNGARWFADGKRILFSGREPGRNMRSYIQQAGGGPPVPLTPEHIWALSIAPDGSAVAAIGDEQDGISIWPVDGGPSRTVPGSQKWDRPVSWSADGKALWIFRRGEVPAQVIKLEIATGRREPWKKLAPSDLAGVYSITEFAITPAGHAYFYSYRRLLSQLYLVRGIK
jgi:dipeptidyl aminopeptidase/acylaminoacyl peptidase